MSLFKKKIPESLEIKEYQHLKVGNSYFLGKDSVILRNMFVELHPHKNCLTVSCGVEHSEVKGLIGVCDFELTSEPSDNTVECFGLID